MLLCGTKRIETDRLILRKFEKTDALAMYENWASSDEVTKFLSWKTHQSSSVTSDVIAYWNSRYSCGDFFHWAIELKKDSVLVGSIGAVRVDLEVGSCDVGYCLGKAWWGNEYMCEALSSVINYMFNTCGFRRVACCHDVNNPNSGKVMLKCGMQKEGVLRQHGKNNCGICDEVWYSVLNPNICGCS